MFPEGRALEFLLAAVVALVVVGPKDLPVLMRRLGQFLGKMRAMAAEFRASFDEMARQSELDELRKEVEAMRKAQFADVATHAGDADLRSTVADIDQSFAATRADISGTAPVEPPPMTVAQLPEPEPPPRKPRRKTAAKPKAAPAKTPAKPRARKPKAEPGL